MQLEKRGNRTGDMLITSLNCGCDMVMATLQVWDGREGKEAAQTLVDIANR
jgi:hypothetical protein